MKKSSAKNFLAERFLGVFKNSALNRDAFSVERFLITPSGYAVTILISQTPSLAVGTADHCRHLIRHLSVTPSPTGEGNRTALFQQQIYTASVGERSDLMKGSLVQRELSAKLTEGLYFFEFFPFYNPSASHLLGTSLYTREAWVTLLRQQIYNETVDGRMG